MLKLDCRSETIDNSKKRKRIDIDDDDDKLKPCLSLDLHLEILSWLPAVTVVGLRSVCKAWDAGTRNNAFVEKHLRRSIQFQQNPRRPTNFLFAPFQPFNMEEEVMVINELELEDGSVTSSSVSHNNIMTMTELGLRDGSVASSLKSHSFPPGGYNVVASCNGWLCLQQRIANHRTCIFNPITNERVELPPPNDLGTMLHSFGFGFNPKRKAYNVVAKMIVNDQTAGAAVCTIPQHGNPKPWRRCKGIDPQDSPRPSSRANPDVLIDGRLHWLAWKMIGDANSHTEHLIIRSFHTQHLKFQEVPITKVEPRQRRQLTSILVAVELDGCLGLVRLFRGEVHVWRMMEYPNGDSWTLVFSFYSDLFMTFDKKNIDYKNIGLRCLWTDNKLYVCYKNQIFRCDPETNKCTVCSQGEGHFQEVTCIPFVGSLVSLRSTSEA